MKKVIVVFSGFNQRAIVAFLRTLTEYDLEFAIIAKPGDDDIHLTEYKQKVLAIRKYHKLDLDDISECLEKVKSQFQNRPLWIAPSTEALNRFLLQFRKQLDAIDCELPLTDRVTYENLSDKIKFNRLCGYSGISIPEEFDDIRSAPLPLVAKPKYYGDGIAKPQLIFNNEDLARFEETYSGNEFYYQRYINGRSFYLLYYFDKNGNVLRMSQENIAQQPGGKSIVGAESSDFHHGPESKKYEELFREIGFRGLVMVEVRQEAGRNYMIEANPRFWGPSQLFIDAGINLFAALLYDFDFLEKAPIYLEKPPGVKYLWLGGFLSTIISGQKLFYYTNNENDFMLKLDQYLKNAVYRRADTIEIFSKELTCLK